MPNYACPDFQSMHRYSRRSILQIGGGGLLGLNLPTLLKASPSKPSLPVKAKSVVFLYQFGGPSHVDMFDMKPDAPEGIRSPIKPRLTKVPGLVICEKLARMAQMMDKVTLVRSVHHEMKNHNSASYYALSGHSPPVDDIRLRDTIERYPAYGSIVDHFSLPVPGLPTFAAFPHRIMDGSVTPGQHASFLGKNHDPFLVLDDPSSENFELSSLSLPESVTLDRLQDRRELRGIVDQQARLLDRSIEARGLDAHYEKAISMLTSQRIRQAFDLSGEPAKLRDAYGRHIYGQSLLLARRLVESGVRFINVYFSDRIGGRSTETGGWDTHGFDGTRMFPIIDKRHLPITDETLPTFFSDLEERGLLDETLVVWMGEFGRTPKINENASRDHWPHCYTVLLAGGGVKRGYVHGASDKNGEFPDRDPVRPENLAATMFQLLGIDPASEIYDVAKRPHRIAAGDPIAGVIA